MRISPATAKFKAPGGGPDGQLGAAIPMDQVPGPNGLGSIPTSRSGSSIGSSNSLPSMTASTTASSSLSAGSPTNGASNVTLDALAHLIAKANLNDQKQDGKVVPSITAPLVMDQQKMDESWKHQEQARAILGNLIGPNGEQLTSTDPYNTTVSQFKFNQ